MVSHHCISLRRACRLVKLRRSVHYYRSVKDPKLELRRRHVETFNGSLRDECLNVHWFASMAEARASIEAWRQDYNESRPHMAHGYASPGEFARKSRHLADRPSAKGAED